MPTLNWSADAIVWFGWLGAFVLLEGLALTGRVPWTTLSQFAWGLEGFNMAFRWLFLIGLAVLLTHIVARWPA